MHIIVLAEEIIKQEFQNKQLNADIKVTLIEDLSVQAITTANYGSADAFFILKEEINIETFNAFDRRPVFINSTINTLKNLHLPENFSRVNGWPTFLNREIWEVATKNEGIVKNIFEKLQWKYITVADEPGLVSARVISMIINEAYFALGEGVSSKREIDLAMKLGTNYPYGPFEWSKKIGIQNVYSLLEKLNETDKRYAVAPAFKTEISNIQWH